ALAAGAPGCGPGLPSAGAWRGGPTSRIRVRAGTAAAKREIAEIMAAMTYDAPMLVFAGDVPNAIATEVEGVAAIVYNARFFNRLTDCNWAAPVGILAHEVGHHVHGDAVFDPADRAANWRRELAADRFAGRAMRRLSVGLDDAISCVVCSLSPDFEGSDTHPASLLRAEAVEAGWREG
ncbi:MAG: hypothetical protein AAFR16_15235, partial [Pseudomonadota bacterium]